MTVRDRLAEARLYGIVDLGYVGPGEIGEVTGQLLAGGVDLLQLRAKGCAVEEIVRWGKMLREPCRAAGVPLVINDFPEVAVEVEADGVHVGQDDGGLGQVRGLVGPEMVVGRSTHSFEQACAALDEGADYIGFGPLFPTPTKEGRPGIGLEEVRRAEGEVGSKIPMFCIGGIKTAGLREVLAAGGRRVVIVSGLLRAGDVAEEVRRAKLILGRG